MIARGTDGGTLDRAPQLTLIWLENTLHEADLALWRPDGRMATLPSQRATTPEPR
jgi:hypothetical protein